LVHPIQINTKKIQQKMPYKIYLAFTADLILDACGYGCYKLLRSN